MTPVSTARRYARALQDLADKATGQQPRARRQRSQRRSRRKRLAHEASSPLPTSPWAWVLGLLSQRNSPNHICRLSRSRCGRVIAAEVAFDSAG